MPNPADLLGIISALSGNQGGGNNDLLSVLGPLLNANKGQASGGEGNNQTADTLKIIQELASKKQNKATPNGSFLSPKLEDAICNALSSFCSKCSAEENYFKEQISMLRSNPSSFSLPDKGVQNA